MKKKKNLKDGAPACPKTLRVQQTKVLLTSLSEEIAIPKQKKKSLRRKFAIKEKSKTIVYKDTKKDQNEDDNKENLFADGEKIDETDILINKMMAAENKDDKNDGLEERDENKEVEDEYESEDEFKEKVNYDSKYGNYIWEDFDEDEQDEPDQQIGKEGAETEEEENELLKKSAARKKANLQLRLQREVEYFMLVDLDQGEFIIILIVL
ncbi:MAG: hypothetical protein EZS28_010985, partial [Streblomastix strix]